VAPMPSVFRQEGEYWHVAFDGPDSRIRETKGMHHIARLLAAPGREIHVLDLVAMVEGAAPPTTSAPTGDGLEGSGLGDAGEVLDAEAKAAYRLRVTELEEELEEARSWNDPEREARAREELDFLARELAGAVGLGGRDRVAASASERARVNVTRAIRAAVTRIREHSPALGRHLDVTLRTGTFCSYVPDPRAPSDWRL